MIKDTGKSIVLLSKTTKKKLMEVGYETERGKKSAITKVKKHEREVEYFKRKK